MRRRFNAGERIALYLAEGGRCATCGASLEQAMHADHVLPWARGGITDVRNGQALCPACNLKKGATTMQPLRGWQQKALDLYINRGRPHFLAEVTPAAGKTRFASEISQRLIAGGIIRRLIVVVPSRRLRKQTARAFADANRLQLKYDWENGDPFPDGAFCGIVVTYNAVVNQPDLYRTFCAREPTLVILDEIHHAAEQRAWGAALQEAFDHAEKRLLLTGTPFRSDDKKIPFINYVDGKGVADFSYGYKDALYDGIVRSVWFPTSGGRMEWLEEQGQRSASFKDDLDDSGQSKRLRTALMVGGGLLDGMIRDAHAELLRLRTGEDDSDAAGLVIAMDQGHAQAIADRMKALLNVDPVVAISDEPDAIDRIERFDKGSAPWIVAVRMVSEGVDIPRLRVCVYATNVVTELFFRQAVGRIVRCPDDETTAYFFIPDDPRLRQFASDIREQRDAVLGQPKNPRSPRDDASDIVRPLFIPMSSTHTAEGTIAGDAHLLPNELAYADRVRLAHPDTAALSRERVAILLRSAQQHARGPAVGDATPAEDVTATLRQLRTLNNSAANRIAFKYQVSHDEVNRTLNRLVGIRSVRSCTQPTTLERRLQTAAAWLASGEVPTEEARLG